MTVASLWKVLDSAGCGKPVGAFELANGRTDRNLPRRENNWIAPAQNNHCISTGQRTSLAIDLSIWICESLTSVATNDNHVNPSLYLVFTRTMKLLSLGIKLVFVVEGKRRIRGDMDQDDKFHKRRSGTAFWNAMNDCQKMLELLGVPVVRAKAEGEALCALLSQRGVVDGVISNDGDCLLFGAKTVYTKFSIENLENDCVMRYDLDSLYAIVSSTDDKETTESKSLALSREDLVAFALLTGSDLAGPGLDKVGHKKAIRFIRKCHVDFPLSTKTAAIDELESWAKAAAVQQPQLDSHDETNKKDKCCTRCCHAGSKRSHAKHGCEVCGTEPGDPCIEFSSDDRFRKSLRAKALAVDPPFDPAQVVNAYLHPNDDQMPIQLANVTSESLFMKQPRLNDLLRASVIIKGRSLPTSRDYVRQMVTRLMSRNELFQSDPEVEANGLARQGLSRERPVAKKINKQLVQNQTPCYEVIWSVNATLTDEYGEGIDGYEYATIEPRELIDERFPKLVVEFQEHQKEIAKQGDDQQVRRREFLQSLLGGGPRDTDQTPRKGLGRQIKKRMGFFDNQRAAHGNKAHKKSRKHNKAAKFSSDVAFLLGIKPKPPADKHKRAMSQLTVSPVRHKKRRKHFGAEVYQYAVANPSPLRNQSDIATLANRGAMQRGMDCPDLTPNPDDGLFCRFGSLLIEITPVISNQGAYPPRHIFVRPADPVESRH